MSTAILESTHVATPLEEQSSDWETAAGPEDREVRSRIAPATKVYRGYADDHWRGQTCHVVGACATGELVIILACGCRGSVPWWTLEPVTT